MEEFQTTESELTENQQTQSTETQSEQSVMTNRQAKDFTDEEKTAIIARAKEIGTRRAAEEFGLTYWVVKYLRYHNKPVNKIKSSNTMDKPLTKEVKQAKDFTYEEKAAIIAKAKRIGDSKTAKEFNTTRWVVRNLRYQSDNGIVGGRKTVTTNDENKKHSVVTVSKNKTVNANEQKRLKMENEILKERITSLAEQVNKLKEAIAMLIA